MNAGRLTLRDPLIPKFKQRSQRKSARAPRTTADTTVSGAPGSVLRPQREGSSDMERALLHPATSQEAGEHGAGNDPCEAGFLELRAPDAGERQDPRS